MAKIQTLAELISTTRDDRGLSQRGLAQKANLDLDIVEDIESGKDLFLPPTTRQKLAMALKLSVKKIKSFEKQAETSDKDFEVAEKIEELRLRILYESTEGHKCPVCGGDLVCRVAEMYDLEDNLVKHPKARCSKCPFQIK